MLKYIIKDLKETLAYLPYGIMAGAVVGLLLNGLNARRERKGKDAFPMAGLMAFSLYLMIILVITFFSREDGSRIGMDLELFSTWGTNARNHAFVVENVLLFIPYGFICPLGHSHGFGDFFRNTFAAFVTSFGVETIQLITGRGYFQVDDILTNVLGAVIGYVIFWLLHHMDTGIPQT